MGARPGDLRRVFNKMLIIRINGLLSTPLHCPNCQLAITEDLIS